MEANLDQPGISRPSFVSAIELSPRTGPVDVNDIKKNLYGEFSAVSDISQRESLESKERIHVFLRIRPCMQSEKESDSQECVSVLDPTSIVLKAPKSSKMFRLSEKNLEQLVQKFTFSQVFGPETTQEALFEGTVKQPVLDFIKGHSRLLFTYGVTNAGKTYTYQGTEEDSGVLPRALDLLFKCIQSKLYPEIDLKPHRCRDHRKLTKEEMREEMSAKTSLLRLVKEIDYPSDINGNHSRTADNSEDSKEPVKEAEQSSLDVERHAEFSVWVSFCEIYNECIYDLLLPVSSDKRRKVLRLSQDIKGCSYVKDLQWIHVSNSKEAFKLMKLGLKHQSFASTKLNANSSRSHSIFTVKLLKINPGTTHVMQVNELFLCDLAGSERCTRTHNEGERLKESGNINTSLLILGKCINALKTNQQSKLQQHIPFRESKLTHFFQGFFSGKGKVCMIVNVSQAASAYDETLNVLRFSAIAQKVIVLDSSNSPQEESFDQLSFKVESETISKDVVLPIKRATMLWERTLEDVMEDEEELVEDRNRVHEVNCMAENTLAKKSDPEVPEEMPNQVEYEDGDIIMGKEEYRRLLNIIEDLKNKLIDEKKDKLLMELRIREEVTQECAQYFAEKESDLNTLISHREEMMEENCAERMQIYKDLVKECIPLTHGEGGAEESNKPDGTSGGEPGEPGNAADLSCMVESLQQNVTDIKQQAEMAYGVIDALEEPQATIERLEKQLAAVTAELSQTREELLCSNEVVTMQENKLSESAKVLQDATEKMALQNKRIQELSQVVEQKDEEINRLQFLINHLEAITKDSENTVAGIKQEMEQLDPNKASCSYASVLMEKYVCTGRKRCLEREEEEEGPPAKQGSIHNNSKDAIETKQLEEMQPHTMKERGEMVALQEKNAMLIIQLATLREELGKEKTENEGFSRKTASLSQELLSSKERASGLSRALKQQQDNCGEIMSELVVLKGINKGQGERIQMLLQELEAASQTIAEQKSKIKAVEVKIGELSRLGSQCPVLDVDEANGKEMAELPKEGREQIHVNLDQNGSFHCSIESIWAVSKQIIHACSQKSSQIEGLLQQVEPLQRRAQDAEDEKCRLTSKLSESINQREAALQEKECLLNQLQELRQENALYAEKYREEENRALGYLEKLKNTDGLLEACRVKEEASIAGLEQTLKGKDSAISDMERTVKDMQEKLNLSESRIREFSDQESQLKAEVLELRSNLKNVELQEKDKEESKQAMEQLNKQLSESVALSSQLQMAIQRKDEEYADLKEKLADAKKQIEQVQRQVCSMRAEEKSLRSKANELEKVKHQLTEELDIKQRTIQQFKKEELNKKLEDISQQYQRACKDLCSKEKIIDIMKLTLEEQEQTQSEQDEILEARLEENERCAAELEEWKKRYLELEKQTSRLRQQNVHVECEKSTTLPDEALKRLQEKLKECEEKHNMDRKKWLAEKMLLITQAKEAETHRNREVKRFAGDREHHARQLEETEKLVTEKENDLQKWRAERDQLVAALEVQLTSLAASNAQKDKEIEELKRTVPKAAGKKQACKSTSEELGRDGTEELKRIGSEKPTTVKWPIPKGPEKSKGEDLSNCEQLKEKHNGLPDCNNVGDMGSLLQGLTRVSSVENIQDQSDTILDSCEVSSESGQTSRFPKPEMEIQFTPLQPNKMEVKHQGSPSTVTIKVPKARKRKSNALDEDFLKSENEKNAPSLVDAKIWSDSLSRQKKKTAPGSYLNKKYSLRSKGLGDEPGDAGGTLQKFGHLLQASPSIIQSKAKKLMATIKSPKSAEEQCVKENDVKPKRAKRKLYSTDISSPMEFSGHVVVMDQKESDHEIIKRRIRTKKTH